MVSPFPYRTSVRRATRIVRDSPTSRLLVRSAAATMTFSVSAFPFLGNMALKGAHSHRIMNPGRSPNRNPHA